METRPLALSVTDAARLIGLGRSKIYEHIKSGDLPSFRIGRRRLISLKDLENFLENYRRAER